MSGIVVGIDGSGHSQRALEWAAREAALRHTSLTVLTVQQILAGWGGGPVVYHVDASEIESLRKLAQAETDKALEDLGVQRPTEVTVRAASGLAAEELIRASASAEMLVVGSRGIGGFRRLLLGSVSSQVAQHARCPVVVIPAGDR